MWLDMRNNFLQVLCVGYVWSVLSCHNLLVGRQLISPLLVDNPLGIHHEDLLQPKKVTEQQHLALLTPSHAGRLHTQSDHHVLRDL